MNTIKTLVKGLLTLALVLTLGVLSADAAKKPKKQKVTDPRLLTVQKMAKPIKPSQIVANSLRLTTDHRAVQSFEVDKNGNFWFMQPGNIAKKQPGLTKIHESYLTKGGRGGDWMKFLYFNNAQGLSIEHAADGDYAWIGSNGSKTKSGAYGNSRTISRVPIHNKQTLDGGYAGDTFFVGGTYNIPAVDAENDILAIYTYGKGTITIRTWALSEALALPDAEVKFKVIVKGELVGEEEETQARTIKCKDLRMLDPLSEMTISKPDKENGNPGKDIFYYSFRGFDVDKDYIYFVEGAHNKGNFKGNGPSKAYITVFTHDGSIVLPRRPINIIGDQYLLESLGIVPTGYADVCGVQVKGDKAYVAFSVYNKSGANKGFRVCVVEYAL